MVTGCPAWGAAGLVVTLTRVLPLTVMKFLMSTGDWHWKLVLPAQGTSMGYVPGGGVVPGRLTVAVTVAVLPYGAEEEGETVAVIVALTMLTVTMIAGVLVL